MCRANPCRAGKMVYVILILSLCLPLHLFFGVSTDKLMGVDEITEMENVEKYLERFQLSISRGEIDECIAVAREGVG